MDHSVIEDSPSEQQMKEHRKKWRVTCSWLPKRYLLAILSFLGLLNLYSLRVNLSVALVAMVSNKTITSTSGYVVFTEPADFSWNTKEQGIILSSFYYGYIITQIPSGYLAARFGGKNLFGGGILMTGLFTLLTPLAARMSIKFLIAVRVLQGLSQGVTFPCMHAIWSRWAPPIERSRLSTISFSGLLAIIWSVFWFWMVTDSPFDHPTITDKELAYIKQELSDDKTESKLTTVPWKELLTSVPMWAIMIAHFAGNWGFITLFTSLPTYLKQMLKFDLQKAGFLSALPYLIMTIVIQLGGQLADFLRSSGRMSTTTVRKLFTAIGFMSQGLFVIIVGYSTSKYMAMFALVMAVGFDGFAYSGFIINHLDIAPRYASLLFGMSNTFATIPGIVGPLVVGFVTTHETREEWQIIFFLVAAVYALGTLVFLIFASGKKQSWADPNGYQSISEDNDDKDMLMKEKIEDEKGTPQLPMKQMRGKNQNL
ncbi:vesicular glutamate transporter 2.1-like isoform X2 [Rhopilema esculentum]|uniref:vesicular glutamate transporter 2.1-like isoform X2 n=1 Tax=Rhopilema esculentum TaxID=499914 RepID=UPI0031DEDF02